MKRRYLYIILIFIFIIGCEVPYDSKLSFKNKTSGEIFVTWMEKKSDINIFMNDHNLASWDTFGHYLMPDSLARFPAWYSWEDFIEKLDEKRVHFYVFNADTFRLFRKGDIEGTSVKYKYVSFSKNELIARNWQVDYTDQSVK